MASSMEVGVDPDQGHLQKQDWVSDVGQSRPEIVNSTETGLSQQPKPEQA